MLRRLADEGAVVGFSNGSDNYGQTVRLQDEFDFGRVANDTVAR